MKVTEKYTQLVIETDFGFHEITKINSWSKDKLRYTKNIPKKYLNYPVEIIRALNYVRSALKSEIYSQRAFYSRIQEYNLLLLYANNMKPDDLESQPISMEGDEEYIKKFRNQKFEKKNFGYTGHHTFGYESYNAGEAIYSYINAKYFINELNKLETLLKNEEDITEFLNTYSDEVCLPRFSNTGDENPVMIFFSLTKVLISQIKVLTKYFLNKEIDYDPENSRVSDLDYNLYTEITSLYKFI